MRYIEAPPGGAPNDGAVCKNCRGANRQGHDGSWHILGAERACIAHHCGCSTFEPA